MPDDIHVLHVDDDVAFADMVATFLEREDDRISVATVHTADHALDRLDAVQYDCVVSDYDMPGTNGIEFLRDVRQDAPDLPFILYTGKGSEEVASEAIAAGVTGYFQKENGTSQYAVLANRITNAVETFQARQKLAERTRQLETLFSNLPGMVYRCLNEPGWPKETVEGEAVEPMTGYTADMLETGEISWGGDIIHSEDRDRVWETVQDGLDDDGTFEVTYRIETENGTTKCVWERGRGVYDGGDLLALEGFITDITDLREHEEELRLKTSAMADAPIGIVITDYTEADNPIIYANDGFGDLTGYDPSEIKGQNCRFLQGEKTNEERVATIRRSIDSGESVTVELRNYRRDGTLFWNQVSIAPIFDDNGMITNFVGFQRDVTERKERERALAQTSNRLELALEQAQAGIWEWNVETDELYWSDELLEILGYQKDEFDATGEFFKDALHPDGRDKTVAAIEATVETGDPYRIEMRLRTADGVYRWFDTRGQVVDNTDDSRLVGIVVDIMERKRREQQLDALHDIAIELDQCDNRQVVYDILVDAAAEVLEFDLAIADAVSDDMLVPKAVSTDLPARNYYDEVMIDADDNIGAKVYRTRESSIVDDLAKLDVSPADSEYRSTLTVPIGEYGIFQAVSTEVGAFSQTDLELAEQLCQHARTELSRLEHEQALERQNERLDRFASVLSHDLRNPLNIASGRLELAREEHDSEHLTEIEGALDRMETLIEDTLALARYGQTVVEPQRVDLKTVVRASWDQVKSGDASLTVEGDGTFLGDPERLQQVFENLFQNAIEHAGESVNVHLGRLDSSGIYVGDNGPGIPTNERANVFESGYSMDDHGTGFGLAIVEEIVESHDWNIEITESSGGGSRFEITGIEFLE